MMIMCNISTSRLLGFLAWVTSRFSGIICALAATVLMNHHYQRSTAEHKPFQALPLRPHLLLAYNVTSFGTRSPLQNNFHCHKFGNSSSYVGHLLLRISLLAV